ncbi:hypothetical protein [Prevotella histicola]
MILTTLDNSNLTIAQQQQWLYEQYRKVAERGRIGNIVKEYTKRNSKEALLDCKRRSFGL